MKFDFRAAAGMTVVGALVLVVGLMVRPGRHADPMGNAVTVVNAGSTGLDSIVIAADPPGDNALAGRIGYVAPSDSAQVTLPLAYGDADIRAYRDGQVVAAHVVAFGRRVWFELRVGDADELGRYRRVR